MSALPPRTRQVELGTRSAQCSADGRGGGIHLEEGGGGGELLGLVVVFVLPRVLPRVLLHQRSQMGQHLFFSSIN
jgi:hypothetical protein